MPRLQYKTFADADDVRAFPRGRAEILTVGESTVGHAVYQPGWRWSTDMPPNENPPARTQGDPLTGGQSARRRLKTRSARSTDRAGRRGLMPPGDAYHRCDLERELPSDVMTSLAKCDVVVLVVASDP
jgi:hypothetical protein